MYGSFGYAVCSLSDDAIAPDVVFELIVGFSEISGNLVEESFRIRSSYGNRDTCQFRIRDSNTSIDIVPGHMLYARSHGAILFGGTVETSNIEVPLRKNPDLGPWLRFFNVQGVDFNQLADRFYVASSYENMGLSSVIEDILTLRTMLSREGIVAEDIPEDIIINKANFNYVTAADAFRDLAKACGLSWNIDYHKRLIFFDRSSSISQIVIGSNGTDKYRNITLKKSRSKYRNKQYLRAGTGQTDPLIRKFRGFSSSTQQASRNRIFNVDWPIDSVISIKRNGVTQRVGVRGLDVDDDLSISGWKQWFFSYNKNEISQNSVEDQINNPTLGPEDILEVNYIGRYPLMIVDEDLSKAAERSSLEGGTGIYEAVTDDASVDSREYAEEKASSLLDLYGRITNEVSFEILQLGISSGQIMRGVTIPEIGLIDSELIIDEVDINLNRGMVWIAKIKSYDSERLESWSDFYRRLAETGRKTVIRGNEIVVISRRFEDQSIANDSIVFNEYLRSYFEDKFSWAVFAIMDDPDPSYLDPIFSFKIGVSRIGVPYE